MAQNTPDWGLPYPELTDVADGPDAFQKLAEATDGALTGLMGHILGNNVQGGWVNVIVPGGKNGAFTTVNFSPTYTQPPLMLATTYTPTMTSDDVFYYAQVNTIGTVTGNVAAVQRNQPVGTDTNVRVFWIAIGPTTADPGGLNSAFSSWYSPIEPMQEEDEDE